ncbi:MAE_28990/MAE_18760 family HEPN-like nuclease, partial [Lactiplantibacillus plantarum]|uniref:MAE_28990/MAE_18760 family HEPN-like nuclease n=1 Tax=Lactiplantibacillus plantarum TaxID=1590 RepID=UPI0021CAF8BB
MNFDLENYTNKKMELKFYLKCLNTTYTIEHEINLGTPYGKHFYSGFSNHNYELGDFIVILKSNTYLMIYNMVESTIRELIAHIYDEVNESSLHYQDITDQLQILWKNYHFRKIDSEINASSQTFINTANKMIDEILNENSIQFNAEDIVLSGDADLNS